MRKTHTQMKNKMLASLLLGCLLVMIALGDSSARVILGQKGIANELYYVTGITTMFTQKGPIDPTGDVYMRNLRLGGKKLLSHEEASMESKNEKEACGGTSKLSGEEKDSVDKSIGRLKEQKDDQKKHMTMIAPKALKFTSFVIPRSSLPNTNSKSSQDSNAVPVIKASSLTSSSRPEQQLSQEPQSITQKGETQNHREDAKQIMDLIHKDYNGAASRRSPINNQEPKN